ncbi:hypothetical protein [Candidatus Entotheonella palauensis]|uniref:hypothetical protein n=1 Tax=Candidatus Entotheonella palauensis TaxID=93172 RepID=UPI000B7CD1F7|nr:hypothetical protein [Candidatus Entotheonella palauensis]
MAANQSIDASMTGLEQSVEAGLDHFSRLWDEGKIKMGKWGHRETLCEQLWWTQATADGMEAVASGGAPYRIYASDQEMDARAVGRVAGQFVPQLADKAREARARLEAAARNLSDLNATVLIHGDGTADSAQTCIDRLTEQWNSSAAELQGV